MTKVDARHFREQAIETFSFLSGGYSVCNQQDISDVRAGIVTILFKGRCCGVELSWDERDLFVDCEVGVLVQGEWPELNFVGNRRVKQSLFQYALNRGYRGNLTPSRDRGDLSVFIKENLEAYARLLKDFGSKVIVDSINLFD